MSWLTLPLFLSLCHPACEGPQRRHVEVPLPLRFFLRSSPLFSLCLIFRSCGVHGPAQSFVPWVTSDSLNALCTELQKSSWNPKSIFNILEGHVSVTVHSVLVSISNDSLLRTNYYICGAGVTIQAAEKKKYGVTSDTFTWGHHTTHTIHYIRPIHHDRFVYGETLSWTSFNQFMFWVMDSDEKWSAISPTCCLHMNDPFCYKKFWKIW